MEALGIIEIVYQALWLWFKSNCLSCIAVSCISLTIMAGATRNAIAVTLKSLHKPGQPLVLANVYDTLSARTVAALQSSKALATASYAVARANETSDDDLTLETNVGVAKGIAAVAKEFNKPLTVDIQDAYGPRLEEAIGALVDHGVAGVNLEDCELATGKMYPQSEAVTRIKRALSTARHHGMPDFVVNARCDTLVKGGELAEVLERGKAYLAAGATTVFVWGGSQRGVSSAEVKEMVKAFDGRLNVSLKADGLTVKELAQMGVARISVGPTLQFLAMATYAQEAEKLLTGA
jgi:2-methylisocitrate lyase-like PEP mutase family enzyme